jgi:hypothetical protein
MPLLILLHFEVNNRLWVAGDRIKSGSSLTAWLMFISQDTRTFIKLDLFEQDNAGLNDKFPANSINSEYTEFSFSLSFLRCRQY